MGSGGLLRCPWCEMDQVSVQEERDGRLYGICLECLRDVVLVRQDRGTA